MSADDAGRDFEWSDVNVVVPEQPAVGCYLNPAGGVVLRQQGAWPDNDDQWIWFHPDHAPAIVAAILEAAALSVAAPEPEQVAGKAKDSTGAERQRRYRESKKKEPVLFDRNDRDDRNGEGRDVTETVTPRDGEAA